MPRNGSIPAALGMEPSEHQLNPFLTRKRCQDSAEHQMLLLWADNGSQGLGKREETKAEGKIPQGEQDFGWIQGPLIPLSAAKGWGAAS